MKRILTTLRCRTVLSIKSGSSIKPGLKEDMEEKLSKSSLKMDASYASESYCLSILENSNIIDAYLDSPHEYWEKVRHKERYRVLARVVRTYLCVPATSNESERLFSKAGQVLSARKTSLSDANVRNIIFFNSINDFFS